MFSSFEKPLLLMLMLVFTLFMLLLRLVLLLFCSFWSLLLVKNSCWPKLFEGSKPNRSLLMALRPLLRLSCISSARGSKSESESEFSNSSSIFWLLFLPPLLLLNWLDKLLRGGTIGKNELGDAECVDAVVELVSMSSLSSSKGGRQWLAIFTYILYSCAYLVCHCWASHCHWWAHSGRAPPVCP